MSPLLLSLVVANLNLSSGMDTKLHCRLKTADSAAWSWFETRASLKLEPELADRLSAGIGFELRAGGFANVSGSADLNDPMKLEPVSVLVNECYLRLYDLVPGLSFGLGRQKIHWGTADAVNPIDNFNPPDYSDPLAWNARRPAWLAHVEYAPVQCLGLELAARPLFEPALLVSNNWFTSSAMPTVSSLRWALWEQFLAQGMDSATARALADAYRITVTEDLRLPRSNLKTMGYGARLKTHLAMFDLSASVSRGNDFVPTYSMTTALDPEAMTFDALLTGRFPARTVVGADLATSIQGLGFWAEAGYSLYDDSVPADELSLVCGADYNLAGFYLNLQYLRGTFPLAMAQTAVEPIKGYLLGAVERKLASDRVLLRLGGACDLKKGSFALLPLCRWMPVSGLELDLGAMAFRSGSGGAFEPLKECSELFCAVRYGF